MPFAVSVSVEPDSPIRRGLKLREYADWRGATGSVEPDSPIRRGLKPRPDRHQLGIPGEVEPDSPIRRGLKPGYASPRRDPQAMG